MLNPETKNIVIQSSSYVQNVCVLNNMHKIVFAWLNTAYKTGAKHTDLVGFKSCLSVLRQVNFHWNNIK